MSKNLVVGQAAPDFKVADQSGQLRSLADWAGRWLLLYFYPRDLTPGCTTEACAFRDLAAEFKRAGVTIVGVSTDSVASHQKFVAKHHLSFSLLADTDKKLVQAYGAWGEKRFMGRTFDGTRRISVLIDPRGVVAKIYLTVKPAEHPTTVLADIAALTH